MNYFFELKLFTALCYLVSESYNQTSTKTQLKTFFASQNSWKHKQKTTSTNIQLVTTWSNKNNSNLWLLKLALFSWYNIDNSFIKLKHQNINQTKSLYTKEKKLQVVTIYFCYFFMTNILFKPHTKQFDDLKRLQKFAYNYVFYDSMAIRTTNLFK